MTEGLQIAMLVSIATAYLWALTVRKSLSLVQFRVAFVGMAAIFGISPIVVAVSRNQDLGLSDYSRFALYAIAMVCFIVAYEITRPAAHHGAAEDNYDPLFRVVGWTFILAGVLAFGVLVDRYGLEFFWMAKSDVYLLSEELGPEKFAKDLAMTGAIILGYDACRRRRLNVSTFLVYVGTLVLGVVLSRRSMLLTMLAALAFHYHHAVRPLSGRRLAAACLSFLLVAGTWNQIYGFLLGYTDYSFTFSERNWWVENNPFDQLRSSDEIWRNVWGEAPQLGRTYLNAISAALVPRFLGGTSASLSVWYTERYAGELAGTGTGFAFSELVEAYINFGISGPLILFGVLGFLARKVDTMPGQRFLFLRGIGFGSLYVVFLGEFSDLAKFQIPFFIVAPYGLYWVFGFLRAVMRSAHLGPLPLR
ncbi:MAG: hypothetical protein DMD48_10315 [Gemmatimonadetes bacterium]|nr:MAG: hypothetical protein DMD48_10315 [Gemmatimonadota bacterium]